MKTLLAMLIAAVLLYGCTQNAGNAQDAMKAGGQNNVQSQNVPAAPNKEGGAMPEKQQETVEAMEGAQAAADSGSESDAAASETGAGIAEPDAGAGSAVKEFTVEAWMWDFSPSTITVNKGDTVRITLVNKDVSHGMAIREFGFDLKADAGEAKTGEFVAGKEGTYAFKCNIFCGEGHREMAGTLVVK